MKLQKIIIIISVTVFIVLLGIYRLSWTPEWRIAFGDEEVRIQAGKEIYLKNANRAIRGIRNLLSDESVNVVLVGIEAASRTELEELIPDLERCTSHADEDVRFSAFKQLLTMQKTDKNIILKRMKYLLEQQEFRLKNLDLLALYTEQEIAKEYPSAFYFTWLFPLVLKNQKSYKKTIQLMLEHPKILQLLPDKLLGVLGKIKGITENAHLLITQINTIDKKKNKKIISNLYKKGVDRFTLEAEWASNIKENFQIARYHGELCLSLAEGAGGYISWLGKNDYSTVDIGTGKVNFRLSKSGKYTFWTRSWMENKCGNSSGIFIDSIRAYYSSDKKDIFRLWVWKKVQIYLKKGFHTLRLKAYEDGVFLDKFVLLPSHEIFDKKNFPPPLPLELQGTAPSLSFTFEKQHLSRGSKGKIIVWVVKHSQKLEESFISLKIPLPVKMISLGKQKVVFENKQPLAKVEFEVEIPKDANCGELKIDAILTKKNEILAEKSAFLGVHFDWYTTGPLTPKKVVELNIKPEYFTKENLNEQWQQYPKKGYDRYRRFDFEMAYGQQENKYIFLYTEINVQKDGLYTAFMTVDDLCVIYIDGKLFQQENRRNQGEGIMKVKSIFLSKGKHRIFAKISQSDRKDPVGIEKDRHTYNNWVFKWLFRQSRYQIAPEITGSLIKTLK